MGAHLVSKEKNCCNCCYREAVTASDVISGVITRWVDSHSGAPAHQQRTTVPSRSTAIYAAFITTCAAVAAVLSLLQKDGPREKKHTHTH